MLILKPLTKSELKAYMGGNGYVEADVIIGLHTLLDHDYEGFRDILSEAVTGSPLLMDISYSVVGLADTDTLIIRVRGDVSDILREEDK